MGPEDGCWKGSYEACRFCPKDLLVSGNISFAAWWGLKRWPNICASVGPIWGRYLCWGLSTFCLEAPFLHACNHGLGWRYHCCTGCQRVIHPWSLPQVPLGWPGLSYSYSYESFLSLYFTASEFFTVLHVFLPESARIRVILGILQDGNLVVLPAKIDISIPRNSGRFRNGHGPEWNPQNFFF